MAWTEAARQASAEVRRRKGKGKFPAWRMKQNARIRKQREEALRNRTSDVRWPKPGEDWIRA